MKRLVALLFIVVLALAGCGGGGSNPPKSVVSGVAATGAPLVGTVYLKDSSNPSKEISTPIASDGTFSFDVSSLTAPFILKAVGTSGGKDYTLYSFASAPGLANVNPLTHLSAVRAYGSDNLTALYTSLDRNALVALQQRIAAAVLEIRNLLNPILVQYGVPDVDFSAGQFQANHKGLDLMFDMISIDVSAGMVTIKNKNSNATIYSSVSNGILSGSIDVNQVPAPPVQMPVAVFVTPASASATIGGKIAFAALVTGTTNQQVTWSVVESNGGSITSGGAYTAPSAAGTYHVKATSLADTTKTATSEITVSAAAATSGGTWKSNAGVAPSVSFTIGSPLGTNGPNTYYSGTIQSSFFGNGSVSINSILKEYYFVKLYDGSWLIFSGDPSDATDNKWMLMGLNQITDGSTSVTGSISMYNGLTKIYSGPVTFTKQ